MLFRSPRERRLWIAAAAYTLAIYLSLSVARTASEALRRRNLLRLTIAALFILALAAVVWWLVRRRPNRREWAMLALAALGYASLLPLARKPEEQLHLIEYGLLGGLFYAAVRERQRASPGAEGSPAAAAWTAFLLTALAGWVDEGIQDILPRRYYGLQDVVVNAASGGLAAAVLAGLEGVRRRAGRREPASDGDAVDGEALELS